MEPLMILALILGVLLGLRDEYKRRRTERERRTMPLPDNVIGFPRSSVRRVRR